MNLSIMIAALAMCLAAGAAVAGNSVAATDTAKAMQTILRNGSQASVKGPEAIFTGTVRIDPLFAAQEPTRATGAYVTFEPGARSAWHTHPLGQTLIVTAGVGLTQAWGGPVQKIHAGDVIVCPPKVKHWHGASATTAMTHMSVVEEINGHNVDWMEKVSDAHYNAQ